MKNNLYFIALLLLASFNTSAQEFTKTVNDSSEGHFIRRIDNTNWLYNVRHYRSDIVQKLHTLTKMDATGTTFPSMTICNLGQMFDMEVADNRAYYIGTGSTVGSNVRQLVGQLLVKHLHWFLFAGRRNQHELFH